MFPEMYEFTSDSTYFSSLECDEGENTEAERYERLKIQKAKYLQGNIIPRFEILTDEWLILFILDMQFASNNSRASIKQKIVKPRKHHSADFESTSHVFTIF